MVFKRGDIVCPNKQIFSYSKARLKWHDLNPKMDENIIKNFSETGRIIDYEGYKDDKDITGYVVVGNASVFAENKEVRSATIIKDDVGHVYIVDDADLILKYRCKIYNFPYYINKEISQISINGRVVQVTLHDGSTGIAMCEDYSTPYFDEEKYVNIARLKALAESLEKQGKRCCIVDILQENKKNIRRK